MAVDLSDKNLLSGTGRYHRIDQPIELEMDESKKNYLHPIAGSDAAKVGAGAVYEANDLIRDERISR